MKPVYYGLLATCVFLPSYAGRLALVGFDKHGKPTETFVNEHKYTEHLTDALVAVEESVVPQLPIPSESRGEWKLRTAVVGFGLKGEVGFGPFKVAVRPRIRAAFANGDNPPIP